MAKREGWKNLPVEVPDFVHEAFERLREDYGDEYGVSPSQPLAFAALAQVASVETLKVALLAYRAECKRRGVKHG